MGRRATTLLASVVLLSATATAFAEGPYRLKPGARGKICLECHVTFEETMKLPHVHTPVAAGDCSDCHAPHSSSHAKLLSEDVSRICLECHEGIVPAEAQSVHRALAGGNCGACHDPHASENPNNLIAAGNRLCTGCHLTAETAAASKFKHSPVEDSCLNCHDPHASSDADSLLRSGEPDLCVACHDPTGAPFRKQHMEYDVGGSRCTSCHDPHGSDNGGILWANVHAPIERKMCTQCHNPPSSPDALQTQSEKIELCRGCHSRMVNETLARSRIHGPLVDETSCLNCHSPHASSEQGLLRDAPLVLCGNCHEDSIRRQERSLTKHPPIEEGDCTSCHSPHSSDAVFLLAQSDVVELCSNCHDWKAHSSHPIGPDVIDPRNESLGLDCLSCHRTHGTPHKYFGHADPKKDLCVLCHEKFRR